MNPSAESEAVIGFSTGGSSRLRSPVHRVVLATHNPGKIREFKQHLSRLPWQVSTSLDLRLPEPAEVGTSYEENAAIKAIETAERTGQIVLADDSGLEVNSLEGAPGVYTALWAGSAKDYGLAMNRLNRELQPFKDRSASFLCTLILAAPGGDCLIFRGSIEGTIVWPPRGARGFGFDPVFVANGHTHTFAELAEETKSAMNHRARAFDALVDFFTKSS